MYFAPTTYVVVFRDAAAKIKVGGRSRGRPCANCSSHSWHGRRLMHLYLFVLPPPCFFFSRVLPTTLPTSRTRLVNNRYSSRLRGSHLRDPRAVDGLSGSLRDIAPLRPDTSDRKLRGVSFTRPYRPCNGTHSRAHASIMQRVNLKGDR